MEAPLREIGKSRGEEKCALRTFKEESEFRFWYVKFVVSYGRDPGRVVVRQVVETVGSEPAEGLELGHPFAGVKFCEPVVRHRC